MSSWLGTQNANNFKQSYILGFLDVCGEIIIRRNGLSSYADSSFNSNLRITKSLVVDENTNSNRVIVSNNSNTNVNAEAKMHVNGVSEYLGNLNVANGSFIQMGGVGTTATPITTRISDAGSGSSLVLANGTSISLNANNALADNGDVRILANQVEFRKPLIGTGSTMQNKLIVLNDLSVNGVFFALNDISGSSNLNLDGSANIKGNVIANSATFTRPIIFPSFPQNMHAINVNNDSSFNGNLYVDNRFIVKNALVSQMDTSLNSTKLHGFTLVNGKSQFIGDTSFNANVAISGNFISQMDTSLNSTKLHGFTLVNGKSQFIGDTSFNANVAISGNFISQMDTSLNSTKLYGCTFAFGKSYFIEDISFGKVAYMNNVDICGNTIIRSRVIGLADISLNSSLVVDGSGILRDLSVNRFGWINDMFVNNNATINNLNIRGQLQTNTGVSSSFGGISTFNNSLITNSNATLNSSVNFASGSNVQFNSTPTFNNGINVNTGNSTFKDITSVSNISSNGTITASQFETTTGNVRAVNTIVSGNVEATSGNVSARNGIYTQGINITGSGTLDVSGITTLTGQLNAVNGNITTLSSTNATLGETTINGNLFVQTSGKKAYLNMLEVTDSATINNLTVNTGLTIPSIVNFQQITASTLNMINPTNTANIRNLNATNATITNMTNTYGQIDNLYATDASFGKCDVCGNLTTQNTTSLNTFTNLFTTNSGNVKILNTPNMYGLENVYLKNTTINGSRAISVGGNMDVSGDILFGGISYYTFGNGTATITFGGISPASIFDVVSNKFSIFSFWLYINSNATSASDILILNGITILQTIIELSEINLLVFGTSTSIPKNEWVLISIQYDSSIGASSYSVFVNREFRITQNVANSSYSDLTNESVFVFKFSANTTSFKVRNAKILNVNVNNIVDSSNTILDNLYLENDFGLGTGLIFHFPLNNYSINTSTNRILTHTGNSAFASYSGTLTVDSSTFISRTTNNICHGSLYIGSTNPTIRSSMLNVVGDSYFNGNMELNTQNISGVNNLTMSGVNSSVSMGGGNILNIGKITSGTRDILPIDTNSIRRFTVGETNRSHYALVVDNSGSATTTLTVNGATNIASGGLTVENDCVVSGKFAVNATIADIDSGFQMEVNGKINATGYNATSDRRLKTNIQPMKEQWENIKKIMPVSYNWIDTSKNDIGFIAQDIYEVYPVLSNKVLHNGKADLYPIKEDGNPSFISMDYGKLTCILWKGLSEALETIDKQKIEIDDLRGRVEKLEKQNYTLEE